jgi:hypothetical protein
MFAWGGEMIFENVEKRATLCSYEEEEVCV